MSTKLFSLILDLRRAGQLSLAHAPSAVLDALAPVFAPRKVWFLVDGEREIELSREDVEVVGSQRLWIGESVETNDAVTRFTPREDGFSAEIQRVLGSTPLRSIAMSADGALRYLAPGSQTPTWHGRWHLSEPPCLLDLATVRFQWDNDDRLFELSFAFSGYPLTSSKLLADGSLGEGDPEAASGNRELVFKALQGLPASLGVPIGGARWSDDGDYAALYRADADEIRGRWLPWLNAALSPANGSGDS